MIYIRRSEENPFRQKSLDTNQVNSLYTNQVNLIKEWLNDSQIALNEWLSPSNLLDQSSIKQKFRDSFNSKCAYCETTLGQEQGELDFFRPKKVETSEGENNSSEAHYFWLTWTWSNFYLACHECNRKKEDKFPVQNQRAKPGIVKPEILFSEEEPLLLDPCLDNPNEHLIFYEDGTVAARNNSLRGSKTIEILGLNRHKLIKDRKKEAEQLKADFQDVLFQIANLHQRRSDIVAAVRDLQSQCEKGKPFAGMKRQLMFRWLNYFKDSLTEYICNYYYNNGSQLPQENSLAENEVFKIKSFILLSLQTQGLPLNGLIEQLQDWLNKPNNSLQKITIETENYCDPVPDWLNNNFLPNQNTIETIKSIETFLISLKERNKNSKIETDEEALRKKIEAENDKKNPELLRILKLLDTLPKDVLDNNKWSRATRATLIHILNETYSNNPYVKAFIVFVEAFYNED